MLRLVLFDIDGTLIESGGAGVKAFARTGEMEFKIPNGTNGLRFAGRTDPSIVREFFQRYSIEPSSENFGRFFDCYVFWLDHLLQMTKGRVLPGAGELLAEFGRLSNPPVLGLLTGNIRLGAQIKLNHYRLWHYFLTGGFGDDHEDRNKIAAIAWDRGCRYCKEVLTGEQILVIGDTPFDIECGKAIDAKVLAVASGSYRSEQLKAHNPNWVVENLGQITVEELCRDGHPS